MATKTITLDLEAYELLSCRKKPGQSFSDVVKEQFRGRTGRDLLRELSRIKLSPETLDAIEQQIKDRRLSPAKAPRF